jgi:hypothetical protein
MSVLLTDKEITDLINEPKYIPKEYGDIFQLKEKMGHKEQELTLPRTDGSQFKIIIRQSNFNLLDFTVILGYIPPKKNTLFRLIRCNGKSHKHTNKLENVSFEDFHIHKATERYQANGYFEDTYAEPTDKYFDIYQAWDTFLKECNVNIEEDRQLKLRF